MYAIIKLYIKYNNIISQFFDSHIGLRQGDTSSPILYMLFVKDMINSIKVRVLKKNVTMEFSYFLHIEFVATKIKIFSRKCLIFFLFLLKT